MDEPYELMPYLSRLFIFHSLLVEVPDELVLVVKVVLEVGLDIEGGGAAVALEVAVLGVLALQDRLDHAQSPRGLGFGLWKTINKCSITTFSTWESKISSFSTGQNILSRQTRGPRIV